MSIAHETVADPIARRRGRAALAATLAAVVLTGCYERVVGVKGQGANRHDVYEPNLKEDEWIPVLDDIADLAYPNQARKKKK